MGLITAWKNWRGGNGWMSRGRVYGDPEDDRPNDLPRFLNDHKDILQQLDYFTILAACRYVYNRFPIVQGAVNDKANFVIGSGWNAQFYGSDENQEWGAQAEDALINWGNICDVRGEPYNFSLNLHLGEVTLLRDGEFYTYLRKNKDGYPLQQHLEAHRIGDRSPIKSAVIGGVEYSVRSGIAYNVESRPMYYHFLGDDKSLDQWIPARDIVHHYNPKFFAQGRGISPLVVGILDWLDVHESRENEKFAQRIFSSLALKMKTPTGKPDAAAGFLAGQTTKRISQQSVDVIGATPKFTDHIYKAVKGGIRFLKMGEEDIESFDSNRPQVNTQNFEKTVIRGALVGLGWGYDQVVESSLGGAAVRRDVVKCQRAVQAEQNAMLPFWKREINWAVACLIQMGMLQSNPQWWMFEPQMPREMTADAYRDDDTDRENYKLGTTTLKAITAKNGEYWLDIREQRSREAKDLIKRAKDIQQETPELTIIDAINLLEQRTPNGNSSSTNNKVEENKPSEKETEQK